MCDQVLFFDNSRCLRCKSELGFDPSSGHLDVVTPVTTAKQVGALTLAGDTAATSRRCANLKVAACNWLIPVDDPEPLCVSCRLTTVRPNDTEVDALVEFADVETAKRRLIHQLNTLGLDIVGKEEDPERGVAFEFRSPTSEENVMTGHDGGVITLDLSESDDAHREKVRQDLGEPYRTVLGHLRHEIGHYYWPRLVVDAGHSDEFRSLFGDESVSYQEALDAHYGSGGPTDATSGTGDAVWVHTHVSEYATMHPWEDWAETFAHYLHIRAGLDTADSFGFVLGEPALSASKEALADGSGSSVGAMVQAWLGMTLVLNAMSRSLGTGNHYPFVLSPAVIEKLDFVHRMITGSADPVDDEPPTEVSTTDDL